MLELGLLQEWMDRIELVMILCGRENAPVQGATRGGGLGCRGGCRVEISCRWGAVEGQVNEILWTSGTVFVLCDGFAGEHGFWEIPDRGGDEGALIGLGIERAVEASPVGQDEPGVAFSSRLCG